MGDRKELLKWIQPGFDESKLVKSSKPRRSVYNKGSKLITLEAPISMQCTKCSNGFVRHGTKFNARKRERYGEAYLGIKTYEFLIHCPNCGNELVFATDPKNARYFCVSGCESVSGHRQREFKPVGDDDGPETEEDALERMERETFDNSAYLQSAVEIDAAIDSSRRAETVTREAMDQAVHRSHSISMHDLDAGIRPVAHTSKGIKDVESKAHTSKGTQKERPVVRPGAKKTKKKGGFGFSKSIAKQGAA
ncbi:CWC16 protein [Kipferlia bialata]|uniref:CWC16 protein n=1 Tax=Kipferlia bialata TaxID=797122 RepID=A0A9K3D430_9EUKA|nr:CWC16 protein [Kipferlia bialata]|eukprot:g9518.t1